MTSNLAIATRPSRHLRQLRDVLRPRPVETQRVRLKPELADASRWRHTLRMSACGRNRPRTKLLEWRRPKVQSPNKNAVRTPEVRTACIFAKTRTGNQTQPRMNGDVVPPSR